METTQVGTNISTAGAGGGGGATGAGAGEVRKIHIVYFISRLGRIEHPHLIRVNHVSRGGVRLRDVKRWLSELRGKDMSESYSWSYKRKYKTGYVWQDLLDDDLITPISDNEYVLKGSEIPSSRVATGVEPTGEKKASAASMAEESPDDETETINLKHPIKQGNHRVKISSEIDQESPPFSSNASTITEDSIRTEEESSHFKSSKPNSQEQEQEQEQSSNLETPPSLYSILFQKRNKSKNSRNDVVHDSPPLPPPLSKPTYNKNSAAAAAPSGMFRNWIRCGNVENQESAVVTIKKKPESDASARLDRSVGCGSMSCRSSADVDNRSSTEKVSGSRSQRILRPHPPWEKNGYFNTRSCLDSKKCESKQEETTAQRLGPCLHRYGPNCSQCGKKFKPHKLHSHMKSCKGTKATMLKDLNPTISSKSCR